MFQRLFRSRADLRKVAQLYGLIVAQARDPVFFVRGGVPDTVEGRFELVALHAWLAMRRLSGSDPGAAAFNQALFDHMFADLDMNLREIGISDMRVGKKVKELAVHFYGRVAAYEAGLQPDAPPGTLEAALDRNLFGSTLPDPDPVARMAAYVRAQVPVLDEQPVAALLDGRIRFRPVAELWG